MSAKLPVRPTTDMAKEALFNIINNHFDFKQIRVLDLFAGTGNISYEFESRESKEITAVDFNFKCIKFIKTTSEKLNFKNITAIYEDVFVFLNHCEQTFDLIFADPPYNMKNTDALPDIIFNKNLLNKNAWLIIEHSKRLDFTQHPNFFQHKNYGNVNFSFFAKK
jgi:16S rRNA (guanine(966)-N(2))-methyltransferase RsmD